MKNFVRIVFFLLCTAFMPAMLSAKDISDIVFEQENGYRFAEEMLLYHVRSRPGKPFDQKILNEDVKRLYATGQFQDVLADVADTADGKVKIRIRVKAKPRIRSIRFVGNRKFKDDKLKDKLTLGPGEPMNDKKLRDSMANLRDFYSSKGYHAATVSPRSTDAGDGYLDLTVNIDENLRRKVNRVSFSGNSAYSNWKLKNSIATRHSYFSWLLNTGLLNEDELENDKLRLRELYWEKGYLDFKVEEVKTEQLASDPELFNITFVIEEGDVYTVREVSIAGSSRFSADELLPELSLQADQPYDQRQAHKDIRSLQAQYFPLGYADMNCDIEREPDFDARKVDLIYRINEGRAYTVQDVNISGNRITKDKVLRRELVIQPGDPVDNDRIEASRNRLMGMGYFEKVSAVTMNTEDADKKDVDIRVEEKNTARFKVGGGFSDYDSLVGMVELSETNFDITEPRKWFRGGGQRLSLRGQYGIERSDFSINFTEPWLFDYPLRMDISGFHNDRQYDDWNEMRSGGELSLTKYRILDDFNSISLSQYMAAVRIYKMDSKLPEKHFREWRGTDFVNTTTLTLSRDTRDSLMEPSDGYLLSGSGGFNVGTETYYRLEGTASNYISFWDKRIILHTGVKIGTVDSTGGSGVPIYERYFLGGGNSIRGFKYRDVGPANANGDVYGGKSMLIANAEISHPIWEFVRGAVFVDVGNAWASGGDYRLDKLNVGVGYGLRIKVPHLNMPMKFDLAYPVVRDQKHIDRKLRFHFDVGFTW